MRLLAFDPGSTHTGFAHVVGGAGRVRFLGGGRIASDEGAFSTLVKEARELPDREPLVLVAVERVAGAVYDPMRAAQVVATSNVAGGIAWSSRARGLEVIEVPAVTVRTTLFGKAKLGFRSRSGDMDRAIKAALPSFVDGLPNKTNTHVRDALALAVAANWMWMSMSSQRRT